MGARVAFSSVFIRTPILILTRTRRTSGLSTAAKRKPKYDPARQWGLTPLESSLSADPNVGTTYVVSGHIVGSNSASGPNSNSNSGAGAGNGLFVGETLGREAQARAMRRARGRGEDDESVRTLLERDRKGGGTRAVLAAREYMCAQEKERARERERGEKGTGTGQKGKGLGDENADRDEEMKGASDGEGEGEGGGKGQKDAYTATMIKHLGFDPAAKDRKRAVDSAMRARVRLPPSPLCLLRRLMYVGQLQAASAARSATRDAELGPRPGARRRSCVAVPAQRMVDLDGSSDDDEEGLGVGR